MKFIPVFSRGWYTIYHPITPEKMLYYIFGNSNLNNIVRFDISNNLLNFFFEYNIPFSLIWTNNPKRFTIRSLGLWRYRDILIFTVPATIFDGSRNHEFVHRIGFFCNQYVHAFYCVSCHTRPKI